MGLLLLFASLAAGCSLQRQPTSKPLYPGASVIIKQAYTDLPNATRIYFQFGRRISRSEIERWDVHCELFVYNPARGASPARSTISVNMRRISSRAVWWSRREKRIAMPGLKFSAT